MKANHNTKSKIQPANGVVYRIKDTIFWKQITTGGIGIGAYKMLFIRSKIQFFESKSQQAPRHKLCQLVVYQIKDTIFWKQITTHFLYYNIMQKLFIRSKIQFFESKSQLTLSKGLFCWSCLSDQRYNFLKANHNCFPGPPYFIKVVYQIKDTIFWKQITTIVPNDGNKKRLFIRSKIQFFESKSQHRLRYIDVWIGCLSDQRYNFLKANHNMFVVFIFFIGVVYQIKDTIFWKQITTVWLPATASWKLFIRSKIQFFESKSQLICVLTARERVVYQIKDTIFWKQITTVFGGVKLCCLLFIRSKIQFFESKSQLHLTGLKMVWCCLSDQRYNFLKANHNRWTCCYRASSVVYQIKDTIFWKQITTV